MAVLARDVRAELQGKADPRLLKILEGLAEEQSIQRQQITELVGSMDQLARVALTLTEFGDQMRTKVDGLRFAERNVKFDTDAGGEDGG